MKGTGEAPNQTERTPISLLFNPEVYRSAHCRAHFNELRALAEPLAGWEKEFAHIELTADMRKLWAEAMQASAAETAAREPWARSVWRSVWLELIWPYRQGWIGLATVWLALLAVNAQLPNHPMRMAGASASSGGASIELWEETRVQAELTQPGIALSAPIKVPATLPSNLPRPRSERKPDWQIV